MNNDHNLGEESIMNNGDWHRTILRAAMDGFWMVDLEGRLLEVNDAYCRMSGYSEQELLAMSVSDLEVLETRELVAGHIARIIELGEDRFEIRHRRKDGTIIDIETSTQYRDFEGGRIIAFMHDITERKQAENEREQFLKFFLTSADLMCIADPNGNFMKTNPAFTETLGYSEVELVSKPFIEFIHPDDKQATLDEMTQQLQRGFTLKFENRYICKDGSVKWLSWRANYDKTEGITYATARDITDKKRADEALRENEERMTLAMQAGNMGLYDLNVATDEAVVNPEYALMLGYDPADFHETNAQWIERLHPDDREPVAAVYQAYVSGEIPQYKVEFRQKTRDGSWKWILSYGRIMERDADCNPLRMLGVHVDISDRKQAEQSLLETEQKLRLIVEYSTNLFYIHTTGNLLTYVSPQSRQFFDCAPEEAMVHWTELITDNPLNKVGIEATKRAIDTGERQPSYQLECIGRKGRKVWVEVNEAPIVENGKTAAIAGSLTDITERKQAEDALRESDNRLRFALEGTNDGVWDVQMKTGMTYLSPRGCEILGYRPGETCDVASVWANLVHPDDLPLTNERLLAHRDGQTPIFEVEQRLRMKSGDWKWIRARGKIVSRDEDGAPLRMTGTHTDLTEQKKLQEQLNQAQKMESVGRLAGGIAHDFNNMLSVILGHAELALMKIDPSQKLFDNLEEIRKSANRSADLTRQLLAFARKQTIVPQVLDLNETVTGMLKMLQRLIGENIGLSWQSEADLWTVKVDPTQIDQILANLCVNARDAIADVGKVTIETGNRTLNNDYCLSQPGSTPGEYVMIAVKDNGSGMDMEAQSHIFEPFFTTKELGKGTGLGLSMVYGIVKQNNGFIEVYSDPDQGTTFKIFLPRYVDKAMQELVNDAARPDVHGNETILLVEDEPAILDIITELLECEGYTVVASSIPGEAIRLAREYPGEIHLLLTDVIMPEMNGRDLARNLLYLYPHLKRLFMSGYTANIIAHHGVLEDGVNFIQKPFSMQNLATKVRIVLDG